MKYLFLTLTTALSLSMASANEDEKAPAYNSFQIDDRMSRLVEIPEVNRIYKDCMSRYPSTTKNRESMVTQCIWDDVQKNEGLKKKVMSAYSEIKVTNQPERGPASEKNDNQTAPPQNQLNYTDKKVNITNDYASDPKVEILSDYFGKKLKEAIDPKGSLSEEEKKNKVIGVVDHKKYAELYKSELGKTIVNALTSYCIDVNPDCGKEGGSCEIDQKYREENIASLKADKIDLDADGDAAIKWRTCLASVADNCNSKTTVSKETKQRSCMIVDYIKTARQNLILVEAQLKAYDEHNKSNSGAVMAIGNMKNVGSEDKASSDAISQITYKDIEEPMDKQAKADEAEIEQCFNEESGKILNEEVCKKFLNVDREKNMAALSEFKLRQEIQSEKLQEELSSDDQKVAEYLKEEGYSDSDIENMTKDSATIAEVREKILDRFKSEKEALIEEMAQRIQSTTSMEDGKITEADISTLSKIKGELSSRNSDFKNLINFSNIVSSYLMIKDGDGKNANVERNVASLFAEASTLEGEEAKKFQEKIKEAKLQDKKSTVELAVSKINETILKYVPGN